MSSAHVLHRLAVAAYLALIVLLLAWKIWFDPRPAGIGSLLLLLLLALLLLPLRGILHGRRYTVAWSTMFIVLYFIHGVAAAAGGGRAAWLGGAEVALVLSYFGLAIRYVRSSNPARRPDPAAGSTSRGN